MDSIGAFLDEEWESLNTMFSCEDPDSFLRHFDVPYNQNVEESLFFPSNTLDTNFYCISQESGESKINIAHFTNQPTDAFEPMNFVTMDCSNSNVTLPIFPDDAMEEILQLNAEICNDQLSNAETSTETTDFCKEMQLKRKYAAKDEENSSENPKKKSRAPRNAQKNKRNVPPRKKKANQVSSNNEEEKNGTCSSEEDSNDSESKDAINSKGKGRATRGSATDPQSLYARRRRERINERLRILQNLVPNGTKVDLSTMLEEAVHYVKFLQMQIKNPFVVLEKNLSNLERKRFRLRDSVCNKNNKLLSSDEMWMYAPIAYNGMDLGLYQKMLFPNLRLQN